MITSLTDDSERIHFFDHLRTFTVLLVLIEHAALAYRASGSRGIISDPSGNLFFNALCLTSNMMIRPMLFFVSGYFLFVSMERRGLAEIARRKIVRLGIPFVLGVLFVNPFTFYIQRLSRDIRTEGFLHYWWFTWLRGDLRASHLWFLLSLLAVTLATCAVYAFLPNYLRRRAQAPRDPTWHSLALFAVLLTAVFFAVTMAVGGNFNARWRFIGHGVIVVRPARVTFYVAYLLLGMAARRNGWTLTNGVFGKTGHLVWPLLMTALILATWTFTRPSLLKSHPSMGLVLANSLLRTLGSLSIVMTLLLLFSRRLAAPSAFLEALSRNSYAMYVIHLPIIVALQYLWLGYSTSPWIKFPVVALLGILLSYAVSEYGIRRAPGLKRLF